MGEVNKARDTRVDRIVAVNVAKNGRPGADAKPAFGLSSEVFHQHQVGPRDWLDRVKETLAIR
jgi:hypothetical protein